MKDLQSLFYFCLSSFVLCGFIEEVWCTTITKTRLRNYLVDIPNSRSSHSAPTPRGGGAVFCLFAAISFIFMAQQELMPWTTAIAMCITLTATAIVGFFDDVKGTNARLRFLFQLIAVTINSLVFFQYAREFISLELLCFTLIFWFIYSLSLINFYNFADGINGYVSIQFLLSFLTYAIFTYLNLNSEHKDSFLRYFFILLFPISGGISLFLKNNSIKKNIFMGDTGSTFLGAFLSCIFLLFSIIMLRDLKINDSSFFMKPISLLLTWVFFSQVIFLDCACMVVAKIIIKIPFSRAHKLHLYQILSRVKNMNHSKTTLALSLCQFFVNIIFMVAWNFIEIKLFFSFVLLYFFIVSLLIIRKHVLTLQQQRQELLKIC